MCLAIPMKLVDVRPDGTGTADVDGSRHDVNLSLVQAPMLGEYVIVHAGFAIEKLDQEEADARIELFRELAAARGALSTV